MKDRSEAAIQYSGYPLSIAEYNQTKGKASLAVIKMETSIPNSSNQKNKFTDDPKYWDVSWFGSYE